MSIFNLEIISISTGEPVYSPELVSSTAKTFRLRNLGTTAMTGLGLYIVPATNVGDVDDPATYAAHTDFQDIIEWGTESWSTSTTGGLLVDIPQNSGPNIVTYVRRNYGSLLSNKIPIADISPGGFVDIDIQFDTPSGASPRRFFINIKVE